MTWMGLKTDQTGILEQEGGAGRDLVQIEKSWEQHSPGRGCAFQASGSQDCTQRYGQIKIQSFNSILIKIIP